MLRIVLLGAVALALINGNIDGVIAEEAAPAEESNFSAEETKEEVVSDSVEGDKPVEAEAAVTEEVLKEEEPTETTTTTPDPLGPDAADDDLSEFDPSPQEDLENKIGTLMALLENKNVDSKTKEQLTGLMDQLKTLGMNTANMEKKLGVEGTGGKDEVTATQLMTACAIMSSHYNGPSRQSTFKQLRAIQEAESLEKLLEDIESNGATKDVLYLIMACTEELEAGELQKFQKGRIRQMPDNIISVSTEWTMEKAKAFDKELFETLQKSVEKVRENLEKTAEQKAEALKTNLPSGVNLFIIVAFFSLLCFLFAKFVQYQKELAKPTKSRKELLAEAKAAKKEGKAE